MLHWGIYLGYHMVHHGKEPGEHLHQYTQTRRADLYVVGPLRQTPWNNIINSPTHSYYNTQRIALFYISATSFRMFTTDMFGTLLLSVSLLSSFYAPLDVAFWACQPNSSSKIFQILTTAFLSWHASGKEWIVLLHFSFSMSPKHWTSYCGISATIKFVSLSMRVLCCKWQKSQSEDGIITQLSCVYKKWLAFSGEFLSSCLSFPTPKPRFFSHWN